ncbi:MAG: ATP-binding protein [Clostridia bacterium]|nr:ATP-binding protein [Clostridia bacterium]
MGSYAIEYLNNEFNRVYKLAMDAKDKGDFKLAQSKFFEASSICDKLSNHLEGEDKEKMVLRAEKLRNIAEAIETKGAQINSNHSNNTQSFNAQNNENNSFEQGSVLDDEMSQFITFFPAENLEFGFEGVIGLEDAKKAVTDYVINPILYPQYYNYKFIDNKGVLLEGPPGTGKTTFAKAVAKEIKQPFALIDVAKLVNCYVGETAKNIDKVFNYLRGFAQNNDCGVTLFFDEFDEIAKKRGGDDKASASAVPALIRNLDGMARNKNFLIIANTNCKDVLDSAVLERFRKLIHIPLPDEYSRKLLFIGKSEDIEEEYLARLDFVKLAQESEGLSGRDITYICDDFKHLLGDLKREGTIEEVDLNEKMIDLINNRKNQKK